MDKPAPSFAPVYAAALYPELVEIVRQYGYALAVHGSLQRDLDVIAIPWTSTVATPEEVIARIEQEFVLRHSPDGATAKPHGRIAYAMAVGFGNCCLDIQFMPARDGLELDGLFGGVPRSPQWDGVRKKHLLDHPTCEACGSTKGVQVHHVKPYHLFPELELDPDNLLSLCTEQGFGNCHLMLGHLGNWKFYNPKIREMATQFLTLRQSAQATLV